MTVWQTTRGVRSQSSPVDRRARQFHRRSFLRTNLTRGARASTPRERPAAGVFSPTALRAEQRGTPAPFAITENRRDILVRLFAGERVGEIAARTGRSESTVQNTLRTMRNQLQARTHVDLMRESLRLGIVTLDEIVARAAAVRP